MQCCIIALCIGLIASSLCLAQQTSSARDRFEASARAGWAELKTLTVPCVGSLTWTNRVETLDPSVPGKVDRARFRKEVRQFWIADGAAKVITDVYNEAGTWRRRDVYCYNPEYAFSAEQHVANGPYVLTLHGRTSDVVERVRTKTGMTTDAIATPYSLAEFLMNNEVHITSCREIVSEGESLVELRFDFVPSGNAATWDPSTHHFTALLDPQARWALVKEVIASDRMTDVIDIDYTPHGRELGRISKVTYSISVTEPKATDTHVFLISSWQHQPIPDSEFRLPSIGLPEILSESEKRFRRVMWTACTLLVLGLLLYLYSRKRKRPQTAVPTS